MMDGGQPNIRADLQTQISKSWHVNLDMQNLIMSKFHCKFSHYLNSHEYFENEFLDFPSLISNYLQPFIFR